MTKLSVVIIAKNEAKNIGNALESVSWADDIVVVDSGSTDTTIEIAKRYTDRVDFLTGELLDGTDFLSTSP